MENMDNLAKLLATALTIITIIGELALIISGHWFVAIGGIAMMPLIVTMWDDLRKENA